jgi:Ca2+-binding EF-hand superfamily protein
MGCGASTASPPPTADAAPKASPAADPATPAAPAPVPKLWDGPPPLEVALESSIRAWGASVFAQFDTDKNGRLDGKELSRALKALPKTKPTAAPPGAKFQTVDEMIRELDGDGDGSVDEAEWLANLSKCAGLAAALAAAVNDAGVVEKFRSFEQQKAKREAEIADLEGKLTAAATAEEQAALAEEMAEYERQVASLAKKIEEADANAAARAAAAAPPAEAAADADGFEEARRRAREEEAALDAAEAEAEDAEEDGAADAEQDALDDLDAMVDEAEADGPLLARARAVFDTIDTDGTGTLSKEELKAGLLADEEARALLGEDAEATLKAGDLDDDGEVTWTEFEVLVKGLAAAASADGDAAPPVE